MLLKPRHARFGFVALGDVDDRAEHTRLKPAAAIFDGGAARFDPSHAVAARHTKACVEHAGLTCAAKLFFDREAIIRKHQLKKLAQAQRVARRAEQARGLFRELDFVTAGAPLDDADFGAIGGDAEMRFRAHDFGFSEARALRILAHQQVKHADGGERRRGGERKAEQSGKPKRHVVWRRRCRHDAKIADLRLRFCRDPSRATAVAQQGRTALAVARRRKHLLLSAGAGLLQRRRCIEHSAVARRDHHARACFEIGQKTRRVDDDDQRAFADLAHDCRGRCDLTHVRRAGPSWLIAGGVDGGADQVRAGRIGDCFDGAISGDDGGGGHLRRIRCAGDEALRAGVALACEIRDARCCAHGDGEVRIHAFGDQTRCRRLRSDNGLRCVVALRLDLRAHRRGERGDEEKDQPDERTRGFIGLNARRSVGICFLRHSIPRPPRIAVRNPQDL